MDSSDVMNFVENILKNKFQNEVFTDVLPKDFVRPSFALELQKDDFVDRNIGLVQKTVTILITGFVEVNAYYDSSRKELNRRQTAVMEIFAGPGLKIGDRHPTVSANKGTGSPDFFEVQVVFSWSDVRPGYHDPDDMNDPVSAAVPKMEDFELNNGFSALPTDERANS